MYKKNYKNLEMREYLEKTKDDFNNAIYTNLHINQDDFRIKKIWQVSQVIITSPRSINKSLIAFKGWARTKGCKTYCKNISGIEAPVLCFAYRGRLTEEIEKYINRLSSNLI